MSVPLARTFPEIRLDLEADSMQATLSQRHPSSYNCHLAR